MEFKIDTKTTYTHITPIANLLDAKLTESIRQKWEQLRQRGSHNLIVDLQNCINADKMAFEKLKQLHEDLYDGGNSLVFTGLQDNLADELKNTNISNELNIAPTIEEAVDIINMEILERDLFNEES
ncbi:MAG TPA: STAS domain-containing protein [Flavipsychrobacter sp.]|nr:STAS domain-containing protein [Flavipsychrobacter sp.]